MKITHYILVFIYFLVSPLTIFGQGDSLVKYTPNFKFKEGVYTDFNQVLRNKPVPKGRILSDVDYSSNDFFEITLSSSKVNFLDDVGNKITIRTSDLWGYSRNGFLYIRVDNGFYRITLVGSCCHFVAYKTYEVQSSSYPYYNSYQYPYSSYGPTTQTQTEMEQFLLDFKTGRVIEYSVEGIEVILMHDPELHDEYQQLSKKKKKQLKFVFIRKFNERNPLYLIKDN